MDPRNTEKKLTGDSRRIATTVVALVLCAIVGILVAVSGILKPPQAYVFPNPASEPAVEAPAAPIDEISPENLADQYVTAALDLASILPYAGTPVCELNGGQPAFSEDELTVVEYELYSPLDELGRAGVAQACLGPNTMPQAERGDIHMVEPTGWNSDSYVFIDGGYLFNRCHLIAHALAGEDANPHNLVTGTRYMNKDGMLKIENAIADYIRTTGNHVLYRVSPVFLGDELVCRGVQIEALSVEDGGEGIAVNVFAYNVQPGVSIDYATGASQFAEPADQEHMSEPRALVLNTGSMKAHNPDCPAVRDMSERRRADVVATPEEAKLWGYSPCGQCMPW